MKGQNEKMQKLEAELAVIKRTVNKYIDLFNADGFVDAEEQKQLETMQNTIKKIETKLASMNNTSAGKEVRLKQAFLTLKNELEGLMTAYGL